MFRRRSQPTRLTPRDHSPEYGLEIANLIDAGGLRVLDALRAELLVDRRIRRRYKAFIRRSRVR